MKKFLKVVKYFFIILVIVFAFLVAVELFQIPRFQAVVNVVEGESKIGINPTTERLDFGDLSRGATAVRFIDLKNDSRFAVYMYVLKFGKLAELIKVKDQGFSLNSGEQKRVEFSLHIPSSAETREYKAQIYILRFPKFF